jgi:hypothetical protein
MPQTFVRLSLVKEVRSDVKKGTGAIRLVIPFYYARCIVGSKQAVDSGVTFARSHSRVNE